MVLGLLFVPSSKRMLKEWKGSVELDSYPGTWCSTSRNIVLGEKLRKPSSRSISGREIRGDRWIFSRQYFFFILSTAQSLERKGGRCCGRPFIDLYSPLPFVSHPPLRSTRDGYLLNARVPFVPAVYEQLRTTSTKFHVSLDQIEFARPRKRPSRSQSPVPSILTSLPETRLSNTLLRNIYPSYLFQYSCVYIYIYIFHSPSNSVNRDIFVSPGNCFQLFFRMKLGNSSFLWKEAYFYAHLCFYHRVCHV